MAAPWVEPAWAGWVFAACPAVLLLLTLWPRKHQRKDRRS